MTTCPTTGVPSQFCTCLNCMKASEPQPESAVPVTKERSKVRVPVALAPTPLQRMWLMHLDRTDIGMDRWDRMPKNARGVAVSNATWRAMESRGWITSAFCEGTNGKLGWHFTLTDKGQKMLRNSL